MFAQLNPHGSDFGDIVPILADVPEGLILGIFVHVFPLHQVDSSDSNDAPAEVVRAKAARGVWGNGPCL